MDRKKYRIIIPTFFMETDNLKYCHFESIVELTDKELEEIKNGGILPKSDLQLIIDDKPIYDFPCIEEIKL